MSFLEEKNSSHVYVVQFKILTRRISNAVLGFLLQLKEALGSKSFNFQHESTVYHTVRATKKSMYLDVATVEITHTLP